MKLSGRRPRPAPSLPAAEETGVVMLVASGGGHLTQLIALRQWWEARRRIWVTCDIDKNNSRLFQEHVVYAYFPTTRSLRNLLRNTVLAARVLTRVSPEIVVSTGAGVAVPFFLIAKILGIRTVYIEVIDRVESPSLTGRICYYLSSIFFVQWSRQQRFYPHSHVIGLLI